MIPFCGFMQANTLSVSGGKPINPVHPGKGIPDSGTSAELGDSGEAFLQWVKQWVGEDAAAAAGNEDEPAVAPGDNRSKRPFFDRDQVLPHDTMGHLPGLPDDLPAPDTQDPGDGKNPSPANVPLFPGADAIADGDEALVSDASLMAEADTSGTQRFFPLASETPLPATVESSAAGTPWTRMEKMDPARPVQDPFRYPVDGNSRDALSGLQQAAVHTDESLENGRRPLSPGRSGQACLTDEAVRLTQPGRGQTDPVKENPPGAGGQGVMSKKGLDDTRPGDPGKPVSLPGEKEPPAQGRSIGQGATPEPSGTVETRNPGTFHQAVINRPAGDTESLVSAVSDTHTASPEDPAPDFQGNKENHRTRRIVSTDFGEDDTQKGQVSESGKNGPPDTARLHPSFQDAPKAMAADPMANPAEKLTAGQPSAVAQTEGGATKPFQATVMDQIVDKAAMRSINGRSEIQIQLKPDFLGKVQMNIVADKDQLAVRIVADQSVVKDIIETHIHHLKTELQNQGLAIEKIEVLVSSDGDPHPGREQPSQTFKQHASPNGGRQQYDDRDPEKRERPQYSNDNDPDSDGDGINYFA